MGKNPNYNYNNYTTLGNHLMVSTSLRTTTQTLHSLRISCTFALLNNLQITTPANANKHKQTNKPNNPNK